MLAASCMVTKHECITHDDALPLGDNAQLAMVRRRRCS